MPARQRLLIVSEQDGRDRTPVGEDTVGQILDRRIEGHEIGSQVGIVLVGWCFFLLLGRFISDDIDHLADDFETVVDFVQASDESKAGAHVGTHRIMQ